MEGQHVAKKAGGSKKGLVIAGIVIVVVIAAYLGLCAWVGASDRIMPNVSVAGLDVSGMTAAEAQSAVEQAVKDYGDEAVVTLSYGSWSGTLTCGEFQTGEDASGLAALGVGRENFLTQGFQYIRHLLGGSTRIDLELGTADTEQPALETLLDQADQEIGGGVVQLSYEVVGDQLTVTKGVTGAALDRERILLIASDAVNEAFEKSVTEGQAANILVDLLAQEAVVETAPRDPDFDAIHEELYVEPQNAQLDPETYEVSDHVNGVDFDVNELKSAYEAAKEGESFAVPLTITQPEETKEGLEAKLFKDLLGQATSKVTGTANRKSNVKLSAAACNGVILMPGEIFSYNNTTGSRSADKGYLAAPIYVNGQSQDDIGGGICQTSSTIYYALLHTTLEVVERHDHQFAVGYVPDGMDATVFYGSLDFRFKNSTDYPIKIVTESYDSGGYRYLTVKLYGTNADGRYAVPESTIYDKVAPTTVYVADQSVARGSLVLDTAQYAYTGRKAQTYRYIYEKDGTLVEKQNMGISTYSMRPNRYYYNPLDGDPSTWVDGKPPAPAADTNTTTPVDTGTQTGGDSGSGADTQTGETNETGTNNQTGGTEEPVTGEQTGAEQTGTGSEEPASTSSEPGGDPAPDETEG